MIKLINGFLQEQCSGHCTIMNIHGNMMKKEGLMAKKTAIRFFVVFFLFCAACLSAQTGAFAALGYDVNGNTRDGVAMGGNLSAGIELIRSFSLGWQISINVDQDKLQNHESYGLFRYYLPLKTRGPFAQADLGFTVFHEDSGSTGTILVAAEAGWRFNLGHHWYIEPAFRGGYPVAWGASLRVGARYEIAAGK